MGELAIEAGIPPGVINILSGDGPVAGAALAKHPGVNKVRLLSAFEVHPADNIVKSHHAATASSP